MHLFIKLSLLVSIIWILQGCGSSNATSGDSNVTITANGSTTPLESLSLDDQNIQEILIGKTWHKITTNVSSFYENTNFPTFLQNYTVEISFDEKDIVAYADCQKLTARYSIDENEIHFSKSTIAPALELASCIESKYADDAVLALFENRFRVESIEDKEIVLDAVDFDTKVILER